jgi:hypothetical protein
LQQPSIYDFSRPVLWIKEERLALVCRVQLTEREEYFSGWLSIRVHLSSLEIKGNTVFFRATVNDFCMRRLAAFFGGFWPAFLFVTRF